MNLTRFAWLSIAAALTTMGIKTVAYLFTGSVGLLSDALESVVNLVAGIVALVALHVAAKPPDKRHQFGHEKAEYFAAGAEGAMIVAAAISIFWVSIRRLINPVELEHLGLGLVISLVAAGVNLAVSIILTRAGRRYRSITLEADGRHLMTDVWTSAGVVVGVGAVAVTGWKVLDPVIAMVVGVQVLITGWVLIRRSTSGLMDEALDSDQRAAIEAVLESHKGPGMQYHALRTRRAGRRAFLTAHILVPGRSTVQEAHDLVEKIEFELHRAIEDLTVVMHVEPLEDPRSFSDEGLERLHTPPSASGLADDPGAASRRE